MWRNKMHKQPAHQTQDSDMLLALQDMYVAGHAHSHLLTHRPCSHSAPHILHYKLKPACVSTRQQHSSQASSYLQESPASAQVEGLAQKLEASSVPQRQPVLESTSANASTQGDSSLWAADYARARQADTPVPEPVNATAADHDAAPPPVASSQVCVRWLCCACA